MADRLECTNCRVPLHTGQDWCVECGSAQPGRLGRRPGWKAAVTVVGATLALAGGATAASYAALSSESVVAAGAPAPPGADPVVAQAPAVPQPPAETIPAPEVDLPDVTAPSPADTPLDPVAPVTPSTPSTPSTPDTDDTPSAPTPDTDDDDTEDVDPTPEPRPDPKPTTVAVSLDGAQVRTYDPDARGGDRVASPENAADGDRATAWEAPADENGVVGIGLVVSLERARELRALEFDALTPGFNVEVYASKGPALPPDVLSSQWTQTDATNDVGPKERLKVSGRYRHVLLWITEQPADTEVGISEVRLFGRG